jgi:uncharacterized protein
MASNHILTNHLRNPTEIAKAYTSGTIWRNRTTFLKGTSAITSFLTSKFAHETNYKLRKELFSFTSNKIAVQFWYEYQDLEDGKWKRCYGLEDWTFEEDGEEKGLMRKRMMSGNDLLISEEERWFKDGVDVNEVFIGEEHW